MVAEAPLKPWLEPDALCALVDDLRHARFGIDLRHYHRVLDVTLAAVAAGVVTDDPARLRGLLAPVLCQSAVEQAEFPRLFDRWAAARAGATGSIAPPPMGAALREAQRRSRHWLWGIGVLVAVFAAFVLWLFDVLATPPAAEPLPEETAGPPAGGFGWLPWAAMIALACGASVTAWLAMWRSLGRQFLQRDSTTDRPTVDALRVTAKVTHAYEPQKVARIASALRVRIPAPDSDLAVAETVDQTVRRGGLWSPVLRRKRVLPEYVAVIECHSPVDHQTALVNEMLDQLAARGVFITRYYFDGDPRVCIPEQPSDEPSTLRRLSQRFPRHRLMLFTGTETFADPLSGRLAPWVADCTAWEERAVFVPGVLRRGAFEQDLDRYVPILPASLDGLLAWAISLVSTGRIRARSEGNASALPPIVIDDPERWLDRLEPEASDVDHLMASLTTRLPAAEFSWLAACAVYPAISWNLTTALGHALSDPDVRPGVLLERVRTLAQLPWFRRGYMPDWLRRRLLDSMPKPAEETTRRALDSLLLSSVLGESADAALEIARGGSPALSRLGRAVRRVLNQAPDAPDELRDYVYVRFMSGRRARRLAVRVPEALRAALTAVRRRPDAARLREASASLSRFQRLLTAALYLAPPVALVAVGASNPSVRFNAAAACLFWAVLALLGPLLFSALIMIADGGADGMLLDGGMAAQGVLLWSGILYGAITTLRGRVVQLPLISAIAWRIARRDEPVHSASMSNERVVRAAGRLAFAGPLGWPFALRRHPGDLLLFLSGTFLMSIVALALFAGGDGIDGYSDDLWEVAGIVVLIQVWCWPFAVPRLREHGLRTRVAVPQSLYLVCTFGPLAWLDLLRGRLRMSVMVMLGTAILPVSLALAASGDGIDFYPDDLWEVAALLTWIVGWHWPFAFNGFRSQLLAFHRLSVASLGVLISGPFGFVWAARRRPLVAAVQLIASGVFLYGASVCFGEGDGIDGYVDDLWEVAGIHLLMLAWLGGWALTSVERPERDPPTSGLDDDGRTARSNASNPPESVAV